MSLDDINTFMDTSGGAASAFPDGCPMGTKVTGKIVTASVQQQTDDKGQPKFFDSGDPMRLIVIDIATSDRTSDEDDGIRRLYVKGGKGEAYAPTEGSGKSMMEAIKDARREAGNVELVVGGELSVKRTGVGTKKGMKQAPFLYAAKYVPPTPAALNGDDWD